MPRRKSKRHSGPPLTFFVDECLRGPSFVDALKAGMLETESVHVAGVQTVDEEWLREAGLNGWTCFSRDNNILRRRNQIWSVLYYKVGLFTVDEAPGKELARVITAATPIVRRAAQTLDRAFVAHIMKSGDLTIMIEGGKKLKVHRSMRRRFDEKPERKPKNSET